jgi:hypothetical protein
MPQPVFPAAGESSLKVSEREMFSDAIVTVGNRRRDEIFPIFHRVRQIVAERERGANRGGISAAGAVRANAFDKRRGQKQFGFSVKKNIRGFAQFFKWPPLTKTRAAEARMNFRARFGAFLRRRKFSVPAKISASSRFGVTSVASGSKFFASGF